MTGGEIMSSQMTKSKLSCKARWLAFTVACVVLPLAGCEGIFQNPPSNMPKLRFDILDPSGRGCASLNGTYQYQSAEGYQFVPLGYYMHNPEDTRFASIRFKHDQGLMYFFSRAMLHEDFIAAAMRMRDESPDRYARWRNDILTNNEKQRIEGANLPNEDLEKPWLTQEQHSFLHVRGCKNGWVTPSEYTESREDKSGERTQYDVQIDVAPDVENGLLVRTTKWKLYPTGLWNTSYRIYQSTRYARLAPAAWPTRWVPNADDLPESINREERDVKNHATLPKEGSDKTTKTDAARSEPDRPRSSVQQAPARKPPAITATQLAEIQDRIRAGLKSTTMMESFVLDGDSIIFGGRVANLQDLRALTKVLQADHAITEVRIAEMSTGEHGTSNFTLVLMIKIIVAPN